MTPWSAVLQGFHLTRRLWPAILAFLLIFSAMGSLATVLLPFEVVNGQVRVPMPADPSDAAGRAVIALGIYFGTIALAVWLLGGVLAGSKEILEGRSFAVGDLFRAASARLWALIGWVTVYMLVCLGAGIVVAFLLGFIAAVSGQAAALKQLTFLGFSLAALAAGMLFLFSPAAIVDRSTGVWAGFRESFRFVKRHALETILLVFFVSLVGALVWWFGVLVLARGAGALRQAMGIPPFAPGLPVFFFGLINGLPQAVLSVFISASLYAYYHGSKDVGNA